MTIDRFFFAAATVACAALFTFTAAEQTRVIAASDARANAPAVVQLQRVTVVAARDTVPATATLAHSTQPTIIELPRVVITAQRDVNHQMARADVAVAVAQVR